MKLYKIELIYEDKSWKGTCGSIGDIHYVVGPLPRPHGAGTYKDISSAMGWHRDHFKILPMNLIDKIRLNVGKLARQKRSTMKAYEQRNRRRRAF